MPSGVYLSVSGLVRERFGGQTRALLLRNRYFCQHAGIDTTIVTFDSQPVYPLERERLIERGELVPGMRLLNLFESYRNSDLVTGPPLADALPDLCHLREVDVAHPDGTIDYTGYQEPETVVEIIRDYRRADGSVYARVPGPGAGAHTLPFVLADRASRPVHTWSNRGGWGQHWLQALAGDADRVFVISDSRQALAPLMPMPDDRFYVLHLMHNIHLRGARQWNSAIVPSYGWLLNHIGDLDGLVTLTARQGSDLKQRYGGRNNMFVVANPVTLPPRPDPLPDREPATFAIVSRFEGQKRLDQAVRAFALVVADRPHAKLNIYGRGALQSSIETLIDELGVGDNITLMGWNPHARDTLWTAAGFLMTSDFEGYPLATLESFSRGCPVISYDIKYGPREQISEGVDGFLVPRGDQRAMADRVIALIDDPERVRRMSVAALEKADRHDYRAFMEQWEHALTTAVALRDKRVELRKVDLEVHELGCRPTTLPARLASRLLLRTGSASLERSREVCFAATLTVRGHLPRGAMKRAKLTLAAVSTGSGAITALPLTYELEGRTFRVSSRFALDRVFNGFDGGPGSVRLRLRLVIRNASWETLLARPTTQAPRYELAFDDDGTLAIHRGG